MIRYQFNVTILILVSLLVLLKASTLNAEHKLKSSEVDSFCHAIEAYLDWDALWLEQISGDECFKKISGKDVPIIVYHSNREDDIYSIYFPNTYFIFNITTRGKIRVNGTTGTAGACYDDKIKYDAEQYITESLKKAGRKCYIGKVKFPSMMPLEFSLNTFKPNSMVVDTVKRTLNKLFPEQIKNEIIRIGMFTEEDPSLWVYFERSDFLYLFNFPDIADLKNDNFILPEPEFYILSRPTEEAEKEFFDKLRKKIMKYSIEIKIE